MSKIFISNGEVEEWKIKKAIEAILPGMQIPVDLMRFWKLTGGGELYETETFLYPLADTKKENIFDINTPFWENGLDKRFLIFYLGTFGLGALKLRSNMFFLLEKNFEIARELKMFSELIDMINDEFNERYSGHTFNLG